jgi:hypothetical protein
MSYAVGTRVSAERTRIEIERILRRYGCSQFQSGWDEPSLTAHVGFQRGLALIRILVPIPDPTSQEFTLSPAGRRRTKESAEQAHSAEERRRWRALLLVIKAKLEAVETGISTLEAEFLSHMVLPNGLTFGEWAVPQLTEINEHHKMPALLTDGGAQRGRGR